MTPSHISLIEVNEMSDNKQSDKKNNLIKNIMKFHKTILSDLFTIF